MTTHSTAHPDHRLISSEDVEGTDVYGIGDESIGKIDHLLIEKITGRVAYAVMSFGGFLGLAHSHYPIPWSALKYDFAVQGYRTGITEAQLKDAPEFSDDFLGGPGLGDANPSTLRCAGLLGCVAFVFSLWRPSMRTLQWLAAGLAVLAIAALCFPTGPYPKQIAGNKK